MQFIARRQKSCQIFTLILFFIFFVACNKKASDSTNPGTGSASEPKSDTEETDPADPDTASTTEDIPNIDPDLDVRTFNPDSQVYEPGKNIPSYDLNTKILQADEGKGLELPACKYPLPTPGKGDGSTISVDGHLGEWPTHSVVAIDRAGDGPDDDSSYDIRYISWASTADSWFIGIELEASWKISENPPGYLYIRVHSLDTPASTTDIPTANSDNTYAVISDSLYKLEGTSFRPVTKGTSAGQTDYDLSVSGNIIELRIKKTHLSESTKPISVDIRTTLDNQKSDSVGPYLIGLINDYACMISVNLSINGTSSSVQKMLIMQRTEGVEQDVAELSYRASVIALAEIMIASEQNLSSWDTNNIISVGTMNVAGLYIPAIGHFIQKDPVLMNFQSGLPVAHFFVAAHELLHGLNLSDFQLPTDWLREGHSNWFATKSLKNYAGNGVWQKFLQFDVHSFINEEAKTSDFSKHSIGPSNWSNSFHPPLYYYRKAAAYLSILLNTAESDEINQQIWTPLINNTPWTSDDQFFESLTNLTSYSGPTLSQLKPGWFGSPYDSDGLNLDNLQDADHDGLFAFQESSIGTDPSLADTDSDGLTDGFESATGTDPKSPDTYTYLAIDNYSADWEKIAASSLKSSSENRASHASCKPNYNIVRYGFVRSQNQYILLAEFAAVPDSEDIEKLKVVFQIEGSGDNYQAVAPFGSLIYAFSAQDGSGLRNDLMFTPFLGKTVEIALNSSWLDDNDLLTAEGTKFALASFYESQVCDVISDVSLDTL